jgi:hypothetical protein
LALRESLSWSERGIFYLAAAALGVISWVIQQFRRRKAQAWPIADGTVEWARARVEGNGRYEHVIPEVTYSYSVQGEFYSGVHEVVQESDLLDFPKGLRVLVHYKPTDPATSFLDTEQLRVREEAGIQS